MASLHLFPLLLTTFLLFSGLFLIAADAAEKENPCDTIARKNNIDGVEQIKCIGRLKAGLLVVTTEMKVWQLDDTSLGQPSMNNTINELYFGNQPPVPIEEKWPKLAADGRYTEIKGYIPTCRVMIDDEGEWLMLDSTIEQKDGNVPGMRWEINKQVSAQGVQNIHRDNDTKFLSSNGVAKFYTITVANNSLQIVQYAACKTGSTDNTGPGTIMTKWTGSGGDGQVTGPRTCTITATPDFRPLCKDPGGTSVHVGKVGEKCDYVHWPVFTGFIDDGEFYFFGKDSVISVPEEAYTKSAPSKFEKIPYDSFIQCKVNPHPRSDPKKKKALVIGLIIALALILLICCLCILLCLVREAMARRQKKDKHGKSGKGKGGKGGFLGGGTARSGGLLSPLGLSKKISSVSKRSTGGLKPGKKLTGAGGSVRTKRSTTPNKRGGSLTRGPSGGSTRRSKGVGGAGGGGGPGDGATRRSKGGGSSKGRLTSSGRGPSKAPTGRSKNISGGRSGSKHSRRPSGGGRSNKATERSKLKNR